MSGAGRRPNLLVAGVTKAGTTSLFSYLVQHPEVCGSSVKETEFFSPLLYPDGDLPPLDEYERYFRSCATALVVVEATPNYWYGGPRLLAALEEHLDRPRYVISLRDPVDRFWSEFTYMQSKALLPAAMDATAFFDECRAWRDRGDEFTEAGRRFRTLSTGCYHERLPALLDAVGDRARVVFFEDLRDDPAAVIGGLLRWLGLDGTPLDHFDLGARNPTLAARSGVLRRLAYGAARPFDRPLRRVPGVKRVLVRAYVRVNGADRRRADLDPATAVRLRAFYDEHNRRLAADLRRRGHVNLPAWLDES